MNHVPKSSDDAIKVLDNIVKYDKRKLRTITKDELLQAWNALFYVFPGLHPDSIVDNGSETEQDTRAPKQFAKFYSNTGWPVVLEPLGNEAWRRYEKNELTDDEMYPTTSQRKGLVKESKKPVNESVMDTYVKHLQKPHGL